MCGNRPATTTKGWTTVHVSVGLVPPEPVRRSLAETVRSVRGVESGLELVPVGGLRVPVFALGNLTRPDADRLCAAIERGVAEIDSTALVSFGGVTALEDVSDPTVSANLVGDLDGLKGITGALPPLVADHGFYVDRRRYAPRATVASVTERTTLPVLEALVAALEAYRGPEWEVASVEILGRVRDDRGVPAAVVLASLPTRRSEPTSAEPT